MSLKNTADFWRERARLRQLKEQKKMIRYSTQIQITINAVEEELGPQGVTRNLIGVESAQSLKTSLNKQESIGEAMAEIAAFGDKILREPPKEEEKEEKEH